MSSSDLIIVGAGVGFVVLAAILLIPVWLFLNKEEEAATRWTPETVQKMKSGEATEVIQKESLSDGEN